MDAEDLGRAKGQDGALDGGYRAMSVPERRDQLVYLLGEGGDLLRHPPVAAPLQRPPGPGFGLLDKRPSSTLGVLEHNGLPPAGNGGTDGTGVRHLPEASLGRAGACGDEQPAAAFEPEGERLWPDGEDVHVGVGAGVSAGAAADEDGGFGPLPHQPVRHIAGYSERVVRRARWWHPRGVSSRRSGPRLPPASPR